MRGVTCSVRRGNVLAVAFDASENFRKYLLVIRAKRNQSRVSRKA